MVSFLDKSGKGDLPNLKKRVVVLEQGRGEGAKKGVLLFKRGGNSSKREKKGGRRVVFPSHSEKGGRMFSKKIGGGWRGKEEP